MPKGFFPASELSLIKRPPLLIPHCGECGLNAGCLSPKMPMDGEGRRSILIVGEAPGLQEDEQGRPFVGPTGELLRRTLATLGVDMRRDCWLTNSIICHPRGNEIRNERSIDYCRPNLTNTLRELRPIVVILLGKRAVRSLVGGVWKEDVGSVTRWVGWKIPDQGLNAWVCPTYHPAFLLRSGGDPVLESYFSRHLREACALTEPPWGEVPDYAKDVEILLDPSHAATLVRRMVAKGGPVAFDFETDGKKPDSRDMDVICCSVCWRGKRTIAYPWHGEAITATRELITSELPKYGWSSKFESRWSYAKLGVWPPPWAWDGMLAAHLLDNRKGVCGLKFQAYARLGVPDYDSHVERYKKSPRQGGNEKNTLRDMGLGQLLLYCGMDSLLEYKLAEIQMKEMGREP